MPELNVKASQFSGTLIFLNKNHTIPVSKRQLLKIATSVGIPILKAASPTSKHAIALAAYKALALKCSIDFTNTLLTRHIEYSDMDPTEKANISYWIGMTFAALIVDKILGVPRLLHASAFERRRLAKVNPKSRSLADLVGKDISGHWHVIEAKARQAVPTDADLKKWKKQARTIKSVDGMTPLSNSYSLACVGDIYSAELVDPSDDIQDQPISIEFSPNAVSEGYYGPIVDWLSEDAKTIKRNEINLVTKRIAYDPTDNEFIFIGLVENIIQKIQELKIPEPLNSHDLEDSYIGSDGIAIITSPVPEVE